MKTAISISDLETLWNANEVSKKQKAIVFELSNYTSAKGLDLIICLENISTFKRTEKFRARAVFEGFSFEHDAIHFLQDENSKFVSFSISVVEEGLDDTIEVFKAFADLKGFPFSASLGFHSKKKGHTTFHFWMGQDMGK